MLDSSIQTKMIRGTLSIYEIKICSAWAELTWSDSTCCTRNLIVDWCDGTVWQVIRMSYRQLTSEEEKVEEGVWAAWEAFLMQMQDAGEFINTQTPLMAQQLETSFQVGSAAPLFCWGLSPLPLVCFHLVHWAVQQSWFAQVNALCNLDWA